MATVSLEVPASLIELIATQVVAALDQRPDSTQRWLSIEDAAMHLSTTPEALRKAIQRGQVPAHQPLGPRTRYLLDRDELDRWVVSA